MKLNAEIKKEHLYYLHKFVELVLYRDSKGFILGTHSYWLCQYRSVLLKYNDDHAVSAVNADSGKTDACVT